MLATATESSSFWELLTQEFLPHRVCYLSNPLLIWAHFLTDLLIGLAYVGISLTLYGLVRRIRLPFSPVIIAFGIFIGACGLTHFMEVYTLWRPVYWWSAGVKAVTAAASVLTGVFLFRLKPKIVQVADAAALSEERRVKLETTNAELQALYQEVKDLSEARTRFFTNVSHELRTPLTLILGPTEKLLRDEGLSATMRRELEVVNRNARILLHQVNLLLDAAKLDADQLTPHFQETDLGQLVRVTTMHFETLAMDRRVHLNVESVDGVLAEVDPDLIQQVLLNLLSNAFKYVPENGRIVVKVTGEEEVIRLSVQDNGPGVPPEWRSRIFDRFRQVEGETQSRGGTGLGLAITRELVKLHQGKVWVEEAPGGGALFVIEVPRHPAREQAPSAVSSEREAASRGVHPSLVLATLERDRPPAVRPSPGVAPVRAAEIAPEDLPTVLVVEDNPDMRQFITDALASTARIETATDGRDGLVRATALRPDVVVTDLMMPHMTGEQLFQALRAHPEVADVPVIILSAKADEELRLRVLAAGAHDYVAKPFSTEELRARVRNAAMLKRTKEALAGQLARTGGQVDQLARELASRHTELSATLEAVRVARAQAEAASEAKSRFLSLVSHELRTPLTSIRLALEVLKRGDQTSSGALERADRSYRRLFGLVESLLEYTSIEAGHLTTVTEKVDLHSLAQETVEDLLPQAQQKLLRLTLSAPPTKLVTQTDGKLVRLILMNLIANALKFTSSGEVEVQLSETAEAFRLSVRDTGPGIPKDKLSELFEPFHQLEPIRSKATPGVGLGLALVKEMARALDARIEVDSTVGVGSTFQLLLPKRSNGAP